MKPTKLAKYDHDSELFTALKIELLDLNDDCLEHILKWLHAADLCRISETCSRLRDVANRQYKTYHSKYASVRNPVNWIQDSVIKCFAQHIQKLKIDYWKYNQVLEQQINVINSCSNGNILHLKLLNFVLCEQSIEKIKNILKYTEKIEFKYSSMQGGFNQLVLRHCPNLKDLTFKRCENMNFMWLKTKYNTLDNLTIIRSGQLYQSSVQSYFNKSPNIKQLIYGSSDIRPSIKWAPQILLENINKIKEIKLTGRPDDIFNYESIELSQRGFVKELNIDFDHDWSDKDEASSFIGCIATHHTFEILGLFRLQWRLDDDLCKAMCNLIHLKVLKLSFATDLSKYIEVLSKKLINLESLYLYNCNIEYLDVLTFITDAIKLDNMFVIRCINLNWNNLKDNFMLTEQRGRSNGAVRKVPLTLHVCEHQSMDWLYDKPREIQHKLFTVVMQNNRTLKMIYLPKKSKESKLKESIAIAITFV